MSSLYQLKICGLIVIIGGFIGCDSMRNPFSSSSAEDANNVLPVSYEEKKSEKKKPKFTKLKSGLQYRILKSKKGAKKPIATDKVTVHYKGWLDDGTVFDSSYKRGKPISFPLTGVIKGWTEGVQAMGVGETIELIIPSKLGYGPRGAPPTIPGGATLHFQIELLKIN